MTLSLSALAADTLCIEPPHWWVGMAEPRLQLLVEGPGIATARVSLDGAGVQLESQQRLSSTNYLVLNLRLQPGAAPGALGLRFQLEGREIQQRYELRARAPGSAQREGFGPKDAIYLVVPDRFAQGGSGQPGGMTEGIKRQDPGGRHGGDLAGLRRGLSYIAGLGFTQIWPTPLLENNSPRYSYHGYAATDFAAAATRRGPRTYARRSGRYGRPRFPARGP